MKKGYRGNSVGIKERWPGEQLSSWYFRRKSEQKFFIKDRQGV